MADDRDLILGELRGGFKALLDRVDRSDEQTDAKTRDLALRIDSLADQHERDKAGAIERGKADAERAGAMHTENTVRLETMDRKLTTTFGVASVNDQWINQHGTPAVQWVNEIGVPRIKTLWEEREEARTKQTASRNRALGATAVWGVIAAAIGGLATVIGFIGLDGVANVLAKMARAMGAN